jgi:hypothetical protein
MKFYSLIALASTVFAQEPVTGSLIFYTSDCPTMDVSSGQSIKIQPSKIEKPVNLTDIKSLYWVYPSSFYRIEFYENRKEKNPYATVVGNAEGFVGNVCKGFVPEFQVDVTATEKAKLADGLFLSADSFYKVIRIK